MGTWRIGWGCPEEINRHCVSGKIMINNQCEIFTFDFHANTYYIYIYLHVYVHMQIYMYTYMYIYTHTEYRSFTYTYIYICFPTYTHYCSTMVKTMRTFWLCQAAARHAPVTPGQVGPPSCGLFVGILSICRVHMYIHTHTYIYALHELIWVDTIRYEMIWFDLICDMIWPYRIWCNHALHCMILCWIEFYCIKSILIIYTYNSRLYQ